MNIRRIAELAGVSVTTVSRTMNHPEMVNAETRSRVERVMKEHGYRSNPFAKHLIHKRTKNIGMIVPSLNNPYFVGLANGCRESLRREGYIMNLMCTGKDMETQNWIIDFLADRSDRLFLDGLIIAGSASVSKRAVERLKQLISVPVVVIESLQGDMGVDSVYTDDYGGLSLMLHYAQKKNYRTLGVFTPSMDFSFARRTLARIREYSEELGIELREDAVHEGDNTSILLSIERARRFLQRPLPDLIFSYSDQMTLALLKVLREAKVEVPADVAVICGDYSEACELATPELTCIVKPVSELGRKATETLVRRLRDPERACENIILPVSLSVKGSA